jgi:hypothetical protein
VAFPSPEEAALAGDHTSAQTRVLIQAVGQHDAVVILMSPGWPEPDCVLCPRSSEGWIERVTTSGHTVWCSSDEDETMGFHASWGRAKAGAKAVLVTFRGTSVEIPVENDHYVWLVEHVPIEAMDEPIEFRWLQ